MSSPFFQKFVLPLLGPKVTATMLSHDRLRKKRDKFEQQRNPQEPRVIRYFHQLDDPYSVLACQILDLLLELPNCQIVLYLCHTDGDQLIPEPERLAKWGLEDALQLSQFEFKHLPLEFHKTWQTPEIEATQTMGTHLLQQLANTAQLNDGGYIIDKSSTAKVRDATLDLWHRKQPPQHHDSSPLDYKAYTSACNSIRTSLGHYSGATFHYGKEFFWGLDRIHHLLTYLATYECHLPPALAKSIPQKPQYPKAITKLLQLDAIELAKQAKTILNPTEADDCIQFFTSYRSPYTYVGLNQLLAISVHYDIPICMRYIMPMVMRGAPVPQVKGFYVLTDAKREADTLEIDFGRMCDPVGLAVERAMRLNKLAASQNLLLPFSMSFLRGVCSDGISGVTDRGMKQIATRAGLKWTDCKKLLDGADDESWRTQAEHNKKEMFDLNLWGPPSFKYLEHFAWGQDRLWRLSAKIEQARTS